MIGYPIDIGYPVPLPVLTDTAIRKLPTPDRDQLISDGGRLGLYLRLRATGKKTWVIRRRVDGEWRVRTLGDFPWLTTRAARAAASTHEAPLKALTFEEASTKFCNEVVRPRYRHAPEETCAYFSRDCKVWQHRRLDRIARRDLVNLVRDRAKTRPRAATKLLAILRQFFQWAAVGEMIPVDPSAGLTPRVLTLPVSAPRERVLTDQEIRELWALPADPYGRLLQFTLLTGCRIGEAQGFAVEQLTDGVWRIPMTKNGRPHSLPLAPLALELALAGWPARQYKSLYSYIQGLEVTWRVHDLRRTAATRMREADVSIEVIEAVLNHAPPRLVRTYQRPNLLPAMRAALVKLEESILAVVQPSGEGAAIAE